MQLVKEFTYSQTEIKRRKIAFSSLLVSLVVGLLLASVLFNQLLPVFVGGLAVLFIPVSIFLVFRSFRVQLQSKLRITTDTLERSYALEQEDYSFKDIESINVKRTSKGTIREIFIRLQQRKSLYINGLNDFEEFWQLLKSKLSSGVAVTESKEPIDYDSPFFYPVLGQILSFASIGLVKLLLNLDYQGMKLIKTGFAIYLVVLGMYFIYAKPISKRYSGKIRLADTILGLIMLLAGILFTQ